MTDEQPPERVRLPWLDDEPFAAAWLDPDAPDPWGTIPSRHLTGRGFAVRLLRLVAAARRDGREVRDLVGEIEGECRAVLGAGNDNGT